MPNIPTNYEFSGKWKDFFEVIETAGLSEIKEAGPPFDKFEVPFKRVISILTNKQTLDNANKAISRLQLETHGDVLTAIIFIEMDLVIALLKTADSSGHAQDSSNKEILFAGQRVMDSIRSLFISPNRFNKVLKALSDMIDLLSGGYNKRHSEG